MKSEKTITIITSLIWGLMLVAEALTYLLIQRLDMLPDKFLMVIAALFLLVWVGLGAMLFIKNKKGNIGTGRRVTAMLLVVLTVLGCVGISAVVSNVNNTISNITKPGTVTTIMTVYVLNENPAQSVEDAAGYSFGLMSGYEETKSNQAAAALGNTLGRELSTVYYNSATELANALYQQDVDAVIMSSAYVPLLEDHSNFKDFSQRVRVLHEIHLTQTDKPGFSDSNKQNGNQPANPDQTPDETVLAGDDRIDDITNTPFLVYISGLDTRSTMLATSRSDVNILAAVNPETKQVLLLNTPRDYYIPNPAGGGRLDKLTHCGIYGIDCSIQALSDLYGKQVDYYAQINFTGFETLIDAIGGVTVYADRGFSTGEFFFEKGENYLNGAAALAFARDRYHQLDGDNDRGKNQMKVIKAVIKQMTTGTAIANYTGILDSLEGMFITDFSSENISKLVKMQLSDMASWNVMSYAVTGYNGSAETYSMPGDYLSVMFCDDDMVAFGSDLIEKVFAGEILTEQDVIYPEN